MRAGPLSDAKVVELLNRHFVPVYAVNEDYQEAGPAPPDERAEYNRIYREALGAKLSAGTVHVYLLGTDGHPFDSLHVAEASKTERLLEILRRAIERLGVPPGEPLVEPAPQSRPPEKSANVCVLHLTARGFRRGSWRKFPSENWLVLPRGKWQKLTPPQDARIGERCALDHQLSAELLTYFYPQTENNDIVSNRLDEQLLEASVVATDADQIRLRLIGHLRMKHAFYPNRDDNLFVEATLAGYVDVVPASREIRAFKLVTNDARYGDEQFGAVLEMVAEP